MFYLLNILIQMKILSDNTSLFKSLRQFSDLGFVPTMGGIHDGHLSLINKSNKFCKKTSKYRAKSQQHDCELRKLRDLSWEILTCHPQHYPGNVGYSRIQ